MRVEVVKTVVETYELNEKDVRIALSDYGGDVKEYILSELEPIDTNSEIEEFDFNDRELKNIISKINKETPAEYFLGYLSKPIKPKEAKGCFKATDKQIEWTEKLAPFVYPQDGNFGDEFKGVRFFKDYVEATDMKVLVRIKTDTDLPAGINFTTIWPVALEFGKDRIKICNGRFVIEDDNGKFIAPERTIDVPLNTYAKMKIDKNKIKGEIDVSYLTEDSDTYVIDGKRFLKENIDNAKEFSRTFKYYIEGGILMLLQDNIEIFIAEAV